MTPMDRWLADLAERIPTAVGEARSGAGLGVVEFAVDLPVEARLSTSGLQVTAPRGRLATGFDAPRGRLRVRIEGERS